MNGERNERVLAFFEPRVDEYHMVNVPHCAQMIINIARTKKIYNLFFDLSWLSAGYVSRIFFSPISWNCKSGIF